MVPSLHRKYIENMVRMFGDSALHGASGLQQAHQVIHPTHLEEGSWCVATEDNSLRL